MIGIIQYITFAFISSIFFHGLLAVFFLALNNIPLSGSTTVYLSIDLLKDILVTADFGELWAELL